MAKNVWGAPGQAAWPKGQTVYAWVRALDIALLQNSSMLLNPFLPMAIPSSTSVSGSVTAAPWSLVASLDHFAMTCSGSGMQGTSKSPAQANATLAAGSTLPPSLLQAFKSGLRNLTLQGCGLSGRLPSAWASVSPLGSGAYLNLYPVYLDLSRNLLTGDLPTSWVSPWLSCYVSRIDLSFNKLTLALSSATTAAACGALTSPCTYFQLIGRSIPIFTKHAMYDVGPTSHASLSSNCGLMTMGFSGISFSPQAASKVYESLEDLTCIFK